MEEKKLNHQIDVNDVAGAENIDTWASFKEKLENVQQLPGVYVFKFVIPGNEEKLTELKTIFTEEEFQKQPSKTGKYVSITVKKWMQNADEVVAIYKQASEIKDIMML